MRRRNVLIQSLQMLLGLIEGLIGLRVILKLFGANARAPFVAWIYQTTGALLAPFRGMFAPASGQGGFVLEFSSLFAMIFYAFMWYLFLEVLDVFDQWQQARAEEATQEAIGQGQVAEEQEQARPEERVPAGELQSTRSREGVGQSGRSEGDGQVSRKPTV